MHVCILHHVYQQILYIFFSLVYQTSLPFSPRGRIWLRETTGQSQSNISIFTALGNSSAVYKTTFGAPELHLETQNFCAAVNSFAHPGSSRGKYLLRMHKHNVSSQLPTDWTLRGCQVCHQGTGIDCYNVSRQDSSSMEGVRQGDPFRHRRHFEWTHRLCFSDLLHSSGRGSSKRSSSHGMHRQIDQNF